MEIIQTILGFLLYLLLVLTGLYLIARFGKGKFAVKLQAFFNWLLTKIGLVKKDG